MESNPYDYVLSHLEGLRQRKKSVVTQVEDLQRTILALDKVIADYEKAVDELRFLNLQGLTYDFPTLNESSGGGASGGGTSGGTVAYFNAR